MSFISHSKALIERLPPRIGKSLVWVPFSLRLGWHYAAASRAITMAETSDDALTRERTLRKMQRIVKYAFENVRFYRVHYAKSGFSPSDIQKYEDIGDIPVVTKADLQAFELADRCSNMSAGIRANTGGTSGQPLEFMLDRRAFAREWAHMHHVWESHGYRPAHLKLTFRGKRFGYDEALRYNAVHNEYVVNANASMEDVVAAVLHLPRGAIIRWLHGYPSLISEFAHAISGTADSQLARFQSGLYGVLLGSEFPAPAYRRAISEILSSNIVSWYGHSEMALLAREVATGIYMSYPSYGFAEAVASDDGGSRLLCTSFENRIHPFIRYDTGDRVESVACLPGALAFRIREGRVGDFVLDRNGRKHALTAIIFGRHHEAFSRIRHLQVSDLGSGRIVLIVTPIRPDIDLEGVKRGFDLDDLDFNLELMFVDQPIRTSAGKIRLKVEPSLLPGAR